ncbi:MAG TPA: hypothetical protein VN461_05075 [Vicinamibacteria bacterium]|nr:hypothetical protein [Vicinamibacteria bacterium]
MSSTVDPVPPAPISDESRPPLRLRIKDRWGRVWRWWAHTWSTIRPGPEALNGVIWASWITGAVAAIIGGYYLRSGFGLLIDFVFAFAVGALVVLLGALGVGLLLTLFGKLPRFATGIVVGTCLFIVIQWPLELGLILGVSVLLVEGVLGVAIATLVHGHFQTAPRSKKVFTTTLFVAALAANAAFLYFIMGEGTEKGMLQLPDMSPPSPAPLSAPNPADQGPYKTRSLLYGSGTDIRRPEYGKSVAIKTDTVDASLFFKDFKGWKAKLRRAYWGFGMDKLPLNGRVWYPEGDGPFPLALIVHGNHTMSDFSDPGYEYLGELLASRGFILASLDENFLNGGLFHDPPKQQAVRGWMLLEHLKLWRTWNGTPGNPFYKKVDVDNVALMGHSRGGEAAATAALFNRLPCYPDDANIKFSYGYPIKSVVAIAPADGQYKPAGQWRYIDNVSYLTLQGANDADVSSFMGSRQWDHVRYTEPGPWFKAEVYVYRANHGQFNTGWGRSDVGQPMSHFLNLKPLLSGEDQRRIAKVYISAFLETTLHDRREYLPLFRDYRRVRSWLPPTLYMSRYQDASYRVISDFSEDPDPTTTTVSGGRIAAENLSVWREGKIPFRQGDRDYNGVFLGWNRSAQKDGTPPALPVYSISLPETRPPRWTLSPDSILSMSLAVTDEKAPPPGKKPDDEEKEDKAKEKDKKDAKEEATDFTIEMRTVDGVTSSLPLSRFGTLPPPFKVRFTKLARMDSWQYKKDSEPAFQTFELPLSAFAEQAKGFDPSRIGTIRLLFDRTPSRVIILSEIGFAGG